MKIMCECGHTFLNDRPVETCPQCGGKKLSELRADEGMKHNAATCPKCGAELVEVNGKEQCPECDADEGEKKTAKANASKSFPLRTLMSQLVREEQYKGRKHLVAPAVILLEGVHNNVLYPGEEIAKFAKAWDGRPVMLGHPTKDGEPLSANSPEQLAERSVGTVFNSSFEDGRLRTEAWIDIDQANGTDEGKKLLARLGNNEVIEVSTGLWTEDEDKTGVWRDEKYGCIAHNFRPDHLALILDGTGACSIRDGAGMPRVNEQRKDLKGGQEKVKKNERRKAVEVTKGGRNVMDREAQVKSLIAGGYWGEANREFLTGLEDGQFAEVLAVHSAYKANVDAAQKKKDEEEEKARLEAEAAKSKPKTMQEFLASAPAEVRESIEDGLKLHQEKKDALIAGLKANKRNAFSDEELRAKKMDELVKLSRLAEVETDFSGRGGALKSNASDDEIPPAPRMEWGKK